MNISVEDYSARADINELAVDDGHDRHGATSI